MLFCFKCGAQTGIRTLRGGMEAAFADIKAKDSLALWERWQPKADGEGNGEGNNHALSPSDAGALPKGEPWFASSESLFAFFYKVLLYPQMQRFVCLN